MQHPRSTNAPASPRLSNGGGEGFQAMRVGFVGLLALAVLAWCGSAGAQQPGVSLVGAWSWQSPGNAGIDSNTIAFGADGTWTRTSQWANGTLTRVWGNYRAAPVSPTQVQLQSQIVGWLPQQFCAQVPGFQPRCSPAQRPPEMSFVLNFTSASSMQAEGMTLFRDPSPYLLQQQVPATLLSTGAAPVQPNIQQPVMPTITPYQTPNGPGQAIANANHENAQNFINGRMRNCYTAPDGRLYGCEQ